MNDPLSLLIKEWGR